MQPGAPSASLSTCSLLGGQLFRAGGLPSACTAEALHSTTKPGRSQQPGAKSRVTPVCGAGKTGVVGLPTAVFPCPHGTAGQAIHSQQQAWLWPGQAALFSGWTVRRRPLPLFCTGAFAHAAFPSTGCTLQGHLNMSPLLHTQVHSPVPACSHHSHALLEAQEQTSRPHGALACGESSVTLS